MKSLAIIALGLAVSIPAFADLNGDWAGELVSASNANAMGRRGCHVEANQDGDILWVGDYDGCTHTPEYVTAFDISGKDLYYGGERVGKLHLLGATFDFVANGSSWHMNVTRMLTGHAWVSESYSDQGEAKEASQWNLTFGFLNANEKHDEPHPGPMPKPVGIKPLDKLWRR